MAPEQFEAAPPIPAFDIFSLGTSLWRCSRAGTARERAEPLAGVDPQAAHRDAPLLADVADLLPRSIAPSEKPSPRIPPTAIAR